MSPDKTPDLCTRSILVVEDDPDVRENLAQVFEFEGYQVYRAENGRVALDLLEYHFPKTPCCLVLDLMMPEMDGSELLQRLHQKHAAALAKIPVIVASAVPHLSETIQRLPISVEAMRKPIDLERLLMTVGKHCSSPQNVQGMA